MDMAKALMKEKGLPNTFWAEAVNTVVYIINIIPTSALKNKTSFEAWHGCKPKVSHLRVFGCIAYSLIPSNNRQKLDTKSVKCIFIGYCLDSKPYRLFNPITSKVIAGRDVTFSEAMWWNWN